MVRIKRGVSSKFKHNKVLKLVKGYYGARSKLYKVSKQALLKSLQYSYKNKKEKPALFRSNYIKYMSSILLNSGIKYNFFIKKLYFKKIQVNRLSMVKIYLYGYNIFPKLLNVISTVV
ncbi:UNVERIFIED_CONTAM: hypothetical protein GTU68_036798 [Idotea baltica]|nr:hypothetical protein [Idotea baltica]